jgi:phage shock protein PspC (stress-responsive transcriptional regulator)
MGVCIVLSERFNKPVSTIRWCFILLGCITGPIAFLLYLGLLSYTRKSHPEQYPAYETSTVWFKVIPVIFIGLGLYAVAFVLLYGSTYLYLSLVSEPASLGTWATLSSKHASIFTYLIFLLSSTAALSAMPLAHKWDKTLSTITNAGLAIYAVILSIGVSLTVTGYLINGAQAILGS